MAAGWLFLHMQGAHEAIWLATQWSQMGHKDSSRLVL